MKKIKLMICIISVLLIILFSVNVVKYCHNLKVLNTQLNEEVDRQNKEIQSLVQSKTILEQEIKEKDEENNLIKQDLETKIKENENLRAEVETLKKN